MPPPSGVSSDNSKKDPTFLRHFDQEGGGAEKPQARRGPPTGPTSISNYFPNIPAGVSFRDYVSGSMLGVVVEGGAGGSCMFM